MTKGDLDFIQLVEYSLSPTVILDGKSVLYVNRACMELLGIEHKDQIVGDSFHHFLCPEYQEDCMERLRRITEQLEPAPLAEQKLRRLDGKLIDVEVLAVPFVYKNQTLVHANYRDITERKQNEQMLMQSEKLSAIGELAAGILHEIRNPLTAIKGFLQFMKTGTFKEEYLDVIFYEVSRIEEIANELLFFSKPKEEQFRPLNIADSIKEALFLFETETFKKSIATELSLPADRIMVLGDSTQLKQVLINLIKNAIEATPKFGEIHIEVMKSDYDIRVFISDTGSGIPEEDLASLGQSFFSTKEKGTGLGLMVTYNIIKNHGGQIRVKSKKNEGTTFEIILPSLSV